jgi:probable F420-dependent oxidoreductase
LAVDLGDVGIWTTYRAIGEPNAGEAAAVVEQLGFGTFWLGGSPRLPGVRPLLEATERIVVATSIVNVWAYEPAQLAAEYTALERDFPGRLLVGVGVGHPEATRQYAKPLAAMRAFLGGLDSAPDPLPVDRRCMAALGPKMLKLSADRSLGAIPYFVPVEHTRIARAEMGANALLAPEVAVALDGDADRARDKARTYADRYLGLSNYANNLLRCGFTAADLANGGSDRLIDAVVPHGTADDVAPIARAHLAAGANHVVIQSVGEDGIPHAAWTAIAAAMAL